MGIMNRLSGLLGLQRGQPARTALTSSLPPFNATPSDQQPNYDKAMARAMQIYTEASFPRPFNPNGVEMPRELKLAIVEFVSQQTLARLCSVHSSWREICEPTLYRFVELYWDARPDRSLNLLHSLWMHPRSAHQVKSLNVVVPTLNDGQYEDFVSSHQILARQKKIRLPKCAKCKLHPASCARSRVLPLLNAVVANACIPFPASSTLRHAQVHVVSEAVLERLATRPAYKCISLAAENSILLWVHLALALHNCVNIERLGLPWFISRTPLDEQCLASVAVGCAALRGARVPHKALEQQMDFNPLEQIPLSWYRRNPGFVHFLNRLKGNSPSDRGERPPISHLLVWSGYDRLSDGGQLEHALENGLISVAEHGVHVAVVNSDSTTLDIFPAYYPEQRLQPYLCSLEEHCKLLRGEEGFSLRYVTIHLTTNQLWRLREMMELVATIMIYAYQSTTPLEHLDLRLIRSATMNETALTVEVPSRVIRVSAENLISALAFLPGAKHVCLIREPGANSDRIVGLEMPELQAALHPDRAPTSLKSVGFTQLS